ADRRDWRRDNQEHVPVWQSSFQRYFVRSESPILSEAGALRRALFWIWHLCLPIPGISRQPPQSAHSRRLARLDASGLLPSSHTGPASEASPRTAPEHGIRLLLFGAGPPPPFCDPRQTRGKHFNANPLRIVQTRGRLYGKAGSSNIFRAAACRDSGFCKPISSYMSGFTPRKQTSAEKLQVSAKGQ